MHVSQIRFNGFKRFSDLTIEVAGRPRLVVLCGPNGSGKSSVFDGLRMWAGWNGLVGNWGGELDYGPKAGSVFANDWPSLVAVDFHEADPDKGFDARKRVYVRTAYRNDPEFSFAEIRRVGTPLDTQQPVRMIDNDVRVGENYQRLVSLSVQALYGHDRDEEPIGTVREEYIGELRDRLQSLFPSLILEGPGDPMGGGTFTFEKGGSRGFPYKNLSGGEKAAFDLLLDLLIKRESFDDTVYCIDEPEAHLNTRVQGPLLKELADLIGEKSQLWIATHSIGMFRQAREFHKAEPGSVVFIDFQDHDFDQAVTLRSADVDRDFFNRSLDVALGDLATLVAPEQVVLCEGRPGQDTAKAEFDARCFRAIFGDVMPDTDFVSVGNSLDVEKDRLEVGRSIQTLVSGTQVIRVIDRDQRSVQEVEELQASGVRVLSRRHLESYLLDDDVLQAFATSKGRADLGPDLIQARGVALQASIDRGNDPDDYKSAAGEVQVATRRILGLSQAGSNSEAFLADLLAPCIEPEMTVYEELRRDIFG